MRRWPRGRALCRRPEILRERRHGFAIYPEGSRSKDGLLHTGKQGAAWLAVESGRPVIPVGLKGTQDMFSRMLPHRGAITVRVGTPIEFDDIDPTASKGVRRRLLNARIMEEIQALSGSASRSVPPVPIA